MRRLVVLLFLLLLGVPTPAYASCAQDSGPEGSPVIFVGTATGERRGYTRFEVEEVWAGPDLAEEVWVLSGQEQPPWPWSMGSSVGSSIDADLIDGTRYVVGASEEFSTNACVVEEVGSDSRLDTQRPGNARDPVDDGATGANPPVGPWTIGLVLASIAGAIGAMTVLARRARRRREPTE